MMSQDQKHQIDVYLNEAGGENTSKMNVAHGEAVSLADQLTPQNVAAMKGRIIAKILDAEGYNQGCGDTLAEFQVWANAQPLEGNVEPIPPPVGGGEIPRSMTPWSQTEWCNIQAGVPQYISCPQGCQMSSVMGGGANRMVHGYVGTSPVPFPDNPNHKAQMGSTPYQSVPAGTVYSMYVEGSGYVQVRVTCANP